MDKVKRRATSVAAAFLLLTIGVGAQGANEDPRQSIEARDGEYISFYGHILNTGRDNPVPMNTQFPDGADDYSRGIFGNCGSFNGVPAYLASGTTGTEDTCEAYTENEIWWFTTPGFVQIKSLNDFDYGALHNERGQTKDIYFDLNQPINSTVYMSADWHAWSVAFCGVSLCWNWDPGYFQDWVVETTVYHGSLGEAGSSASDKPDMNLIYGNDDATVIAYGRDGPKAIASFDPSLQAVAGPLCDGPCDTVVGFYPVLEYSEEFIAQGGIVPKDNDIVVRQQWYQETGSDQYILGAGAVVGLAWNLNGGEDWPANVVFPIKNPLDVELVFPRFIHDKLVILSVLNTPWGSYDVDLDSIELEIRDDFGAVVDVDPSTIAFDLDVSVAHAGHYNPIDVTWVWDYQDQGLPPGDYTATVKARNFQGSYDTETIASFSIADDGTGGDVEYGTEGLLSFTDNQLDEFNDGSAGQVDTPDETTEPETDDVSEDSPAPALLVLMALFGVVAWRGRKE